MKKTLLTLIISCLLFSVHGQKLDLQNEYAFESLKTDTYLGSVEYNSDTKVTSLIYVEKDMLVTKFITYNFDENLKFINEESKSFNIIDASKEAIMEVQEQFKWFDYKGESYTKSWIDINPGFGGKIIVSRQTVTYNYNWSLGIYIPKASPAEVVKVKSDTDDKIYLYDHVVNTETGEAFLLVGVKANKDTKVKYQHARKFQIVKITNDLEPVYLEEINFEYNMAISFNQLLYESGYGPEEESEVMDISHAKSVLIFSPIKTMLGKKYSNPNAGENTMVVINKDGKIEAKIPYTTETTGWVVENMVSSSDGKDLFFYGPAKDKAYINSVMPTNSPLTGRTEVKDIKWKNFQVMKISDNTFQWINSTDLKDFKTKAVAPPSQKRLPLYNGKKFQKTMSFITPEGELLIAGQNYTMKNIPDPNSNQAGATIKVIDDYKDLVMFHFDNKGVLKAQYGVRRDKMNKYSKSMLTPQDLYLDPNTNSLYWVYGEIKGMKKGFGLTGGLLEVAGVGSISKRKLLYYPTVAKIDLSAGTVGDFLPLGADAEGKQKYYTNPSFPQLLSPDGTNLTFIGEDKKGTLVWLGRMFIN